MLFNMHAVTIIFLFLALKIEKNSVEQRKLEEQSDIKVYRNQHFHKKGFKDEPPFRAEGL